MAGLDPVRRRLRAGVAARSRARGNARTQWLNGSAGGLLPAGEQQRHLLPAVGQRLGQRRVRGADPAGQRRADELVAGDADAWRGLVGPRRSRRRVEPEPERARRQRRAHARRRRVRETRAGRARRAARASRAQSVSPIQAGSSPCSASAASSSSAVQRAPVALRRLATRAGRASATRDQRGPAGRARDPERSSSESATASGSRRFPEPVGHRRGGVPVGARAVDARSTRLDSRSSARTGTRPAARRGRGEARHPTTTTRSAPSRREIDGQPGEIGRQPGRSSGCALRSRDRPRRASARARSRSGTCSAARGRAAAFSARAARSRFGPSHSRTIQASVT